MSLSQVEFERIDVNPWQTRLADDAEHIARLADDIAANDLLQTPLGRQHPTDPGRVQIAFGHSRLAALKLLVETKRRTDRRMPVDVHQLTDLQMSTFAASENAQRKNLSAIETATAIQRRIADFKLSQLEAAKPFGYTSQGGVSNLLRLLKLPDHTRELVHTGAVPERIARLLLPVVRFNAEEVDKIGDVVAKASPDDRDEIAERKLTDFLGKNGRNLNWSTPWKMEFPSKPVPVTPELAKGIGGVPAEIPPCKGCEFNIEARGNGYCMRPACWEVKWRLHLQADLKKASEKTGIAIAGPDDKVVCVYDGKGYNYAEQKRAARLVTSKAPILRLGLIDLKEHRQGESNLQEVTGSSFVMLLATNKAEADRIMATFSGQKAREMAQANESEAEKARRVEREEKQREEGRAERAKQFRARADINWLIVTAGCWLGKQIDATGGALEFLANEVELQYWKHGNTSLFDSATIDHRKRLDSVANKSQGKAREVILRERLIVDVITHEIAAQYQDPWFDWARALSVTARVTEKEFRAKLPAGWNEPPIHRGPTDCWQCGKFGSNIDHITNGEKAKGWIDGGEAGVFCSDAHQKQYQSAQAKGAARPATKAKKK